MRLIRVWPRRSMFKKASAVAAALLTLASPLYLILGPVPLAHAASAVSSSDVTVNEADGAATFTFTLNGSTETQYTYQTVDGSAVAPDDYTASSGTLQFNTQTTDLPTATVTVPITDDTIPEPTESFSIEVYSNIDGPVLEDTWTATILDDDTEVVPPQNPTITSNDVTVNESDGTATFTFAIDGFPEFDYTYRTVDGIATSPTDYTGTTGTLQFDNNDSRQHFATVTVPIVNDTIPEPTESFSIEVYSNIDGPVLEGTWTATILDDDTVITPPTDTPPPIIPPVVPPVVPPTTPPTAMPVTPTDATPITTPAETPTSIPTPQPTPSPTPSPASIPTPAITSVLADVTPSFEPEPVPETDAIPPANVTPIPPLAVTVLPHVPSPLAVPQVGSYRSAFVRSVPDPTQLSRSAKAIITSLLLAALLILLIAFPADLFNSTLAANYDEISGWFKIGKLHNLASTLRKTPTPIAIGGFALIGALLNSQLSPDFGWNKASLALLLGMLITIIIAALLYDISRAIYLKQRYEVKSKLRIHVLGLGTGGILVAASRLSHFLPGYFYGMFTALVYGDETPDQQDGEGLAISSILLLVVAAVGWFAWIPVKHAAVKPAAGLPILVLDATLSSLWVSALSAIVFALAPLRFFYGEQVKKWSGKGWLVIYGLGMSLFVYTLLHPGQNFYGTTGKTTMRSVLTLFIGFGLFSLIFWAYFRYRPTRLQPRNQTN